MELTQGARVTRPQLGVRYGPEGMEPHRRPHPKSPRSGLARSSDDLVRPRSAATIWEPKATPFVYSRVAAVLWIGTGVLMAFASTSVGAVLLIGHELRRSVAAAFILGLVETAASLSLGLALWSGPTRLVLAASVLFGAFMVATGLLASSWGFFLALVAGSAAVVSLFLLREHIQRDSDEAAASIDSWDEIEAPSA